MTDSPHGPTPRTLVLVVVAALLSSCSRDEELQRQIVELRAAVQIKAKALEEAESKIASTPPPVAPTIKTPTGPSAADLAKAQSRVTELEDQVSQLTAKLQAQPTTPATTPVSMKFDVDVIKDKLEDDLTHKAGELRDLVLRQNGVTSISEISIQRVQYPPEVITPFHSAITFTVMDNGKTMRVQFSVTADFSGSWHLPSPDKIQQACQQAREQMASGHAPAPQTTPPSPKSSPPSSPQSPRPIASAPPNSTARGANMKQVDANTFVMDWGDKPAAAKAPASAPTQAQADPSPPSAETPTPAPPPQKSTTRTPSPPKPSAPNVPPPIMPVQRDIIIKF